MFRKEKPSLPTQQEYYANFEDWKKRIEDYVFRYALNKTKQNSSAGKFKSLVIRGDDYQDWQCQHHYNFAAHQKEFDSFLEEQWKNFTIKQEGETQSKLRTPTDRFVSFNEEINKNADPFKDYVSLKEEKTDDNNQKTTSEREQRVINCFPMVVELLSRADYQKERNRLTALLLDHQYYSLYIGNKNKNKIKSSYKNKDFLTIIRKFYTFLEKHFPEMKVRDFQTDSQRFVALKKSFGKSTNNKLPHAKRTIKRLAEQLTENLPKEAGTYLRKMLENLTLHSQLKEVPSVNYTGIDEFRCRQSKLREKSKKIKGFCKKYERTGLLYASFALFRQGQVFMQNNPNFMKHWCKCKRCQNAVKNAKTLQEKHAAIYKPIYPVHQRGKSDFTTSKQWIEFYWKLFMKNKTPGNLYAFLRLCYGNKQQEKARACWRKYQNNSNFHSLAATSLIKKLEQGA